MCTERPYLITFHRGLFFEKHLKHIALNRQFVKFTDHDLSYLLRDKYDPQFMNQVYSAPSITQKELRGGKLDTSEPLPPSVRLTYEERHTYKATAKAFSLMDDFRVRLLMVVQVLVTGSGCALDQLKINIPWSS